MADMLVRLYALPDATPALERAASAGAVLRRPEAFERSRVVEWVRSTFSPGWADEVDIAFASRPPSCFIAIAAGEVVGFACHDTTRPNFFGPAGVAPTARGAGIGAALTLVTLSAMRSAGYAYAIIGGVGPVDFYARVAGATPIEGSTPGIYGTALAKR